MTLWGEWHTHSAGVDEYVDPPACVTERFVEWSQLPTFES